MLALKGSVRDAGGYDNPDLILDDSTAIEVETCLKPSLEGFPSR